MYNKKISDKLDILLITYNRASKLENTLKQLLAENSPVKDFSITIIDNNSTDDTSIVVQKYQTLHNNLHYGKNKYNIGGNANIVKAFYEANKEYVWVLSDDDDYDWTCWGEVVSFIEEKADCIIVADTDYPYLGIEQLFAQTSFLPGAIYKMSNFDETLLDNMFYNISNMFPHLAFSAKLLNENKIFKIVSLPLVLYKGDNLLTLLQTYTRGTNSENLHPDRATLSYIGGYTNALLLIKDVKLRQRLAEKRRFYSSSLASADIMFENSQYYNGSIYNLLNIFRVLGVVQKIRFLINLVLYYSLYRICYFYSKEYYDRNSEKVTCIYMVRLFSILKTKLFKIQYKIKRRNT